MITYNYRCKNEECKHEEEIKQRISENKIIVCTKCKQETFERVLQASSFTLKGKWFKNGGY